MSIFDVKWLYQLNVFKPPVRYVRVNIILSLLAINIYMFLAKHIINRDMAIIKRYSNTIINIPTSYHRETNKNLYIHICYFF